MSRRKTDGERIVKVLRNDNWMRLWLPDGAAYIDRIIRHRMAEAWDLGRTYGINNIAADANPYRGRRRVKP